MGTIFAHADPKHRLLLFVLCCVPLRVGLAAGLWVLRGETAVHVLAFVFGVCATIFLMMRIINDNRVWWSREIHTVMSVLLVFAAALAIGFSESSVAVAMPAVVAAADVGAGVFTALITRPFSPLTE